jgi:haloalkane dehalogenase
MQKSQTVSYIEHVVQRGPYHIYAREYPGEEPAIVLMHGFPDNLHLYDRLVPWLITSRRVVTFDFLGWGESEKPAGYPYTAANQAGDLDAVITQLKLEQVVLLAHDASGPPAIDWALAHAERVAALVLLNTYYCTMPTLRPPEVIRLMSTPLVRNVARAVSTAFDNWLFRRLYWWQVGGFMREAADREEFLPLLYHQFAATPSAQGAFFRLNEDLLSAVRDRTKRIPQMQAFSRPVRIIFGASDPYLNVGVARRFHDLFPTSELFLLPGARHFVQIDEPEQVAQLILSTPLADRAQVSLPHSQYPASVLPQQNGSVMSTSIASKPALIPAAEWFGGGRRVPYDPDRHRVLTSHDDLSTPHLMVFERVVGAPRMDAEGRWMTLLPGFPDGSYGYAYVNALLGDELVPRLYLEYVGQGDSDKPRNYAYSTIERADLVEAQWQAHEVRRTFVVAFDYSSLVVLELLARQEERLGRGERLATRIDSVFLANGGLFADAQSHPWQTTPLLKTPLGALSMQFAQRSPALFALILRNANLFSPGYGVTMAELREEYDAITRRDGAAFLHHGARFVDEHQAHATRWDLARLYHALSGSVQFCIAGSTEDPYEPRQIVEARARLGAAGLDIRMFPGGHLTTTEHPDLLAAVIHERALAWLQP